MSNKDDKPKTRKNKNDLNNAWAAMRFVVVACLLISGVILLGWVDNIPEGAMKAMGAFLVAMGSTLMFLWFRYSKVKF